jgi:hypothetical protein
VCQSLSVCLCADADISGVTSSCVSDEVTQKPVLTGCDYTGHAGYAAGTVANDSVHPDGSPGNDVEQFHSTTDC